MTTILTRVEFTRENGVPADNTSNTFVFTGTGTAYDLALTANTALDLFYAAAHPFGGNVVTKVGGMINNTIDRVAKQKTYDITGKLAKDPETGKFPAMGAPVRVLNLNLPAPHYADLFPGEVSVCGSYRFGGAGQYAEDIPAGPEGPVGNIHDAARHRGRIFIGPLCYGPGMFTTDGTADLRPSAAVRDVLAAACNDLAENTTISWSLWSRTLGLTFAVQSGWVDDAFDTQRRRGAQPTTRTNWTGIPG